MTIPVYPAGLPLPLRESYGFTPTNNIRRTQMDSGRARQRIEFRNVPTMAQLSWTLNASEAMLFEAWAAQVAGAGWFTMPLLTPMGFDNYEVRFTETPVGGDLRGKFLWQYRGACEIRNRPLLEAGWAEFLPDYILMADIFDRAVNSQWPDNFYQTFMDTFDFAANEEWPAP